VQSSKRWTSNSFIRAIRCTQLLVISYQLSVVGGTQSIWNDGPQSKPCKAASFGLKIRLSAQFVVLRRQIRLSAQFAVLRHQIRLSAQFVVLRRQIRLSA